MNSKSVSTAIFLLILLVVGGIWYWQGRADRERAAVGREIQKILDESPGVDVPNGKVFKIESPELAKKMGQMSDGAGIQQIVLEGDFMAKAMGSMAKRYQRILDMPPAERNKELDKAIDAQRNSDNELPGFIKEMKDKAGPSDGGVQKVTEVTEDGNRVGMFVDGRSNDGERFMGDNTTPEVRAPLDAYKDAIHRRMKERGIDPGDIPITMSFTMEASSNE